MADESGSVSERDPSVAAADFKAQAGAIARALIHRASEAALGTLTKTGAPMVSHVSVAALADGAPAILVSDLALHTANLKRDARASLLFVDRQDPAGGDTNARGRLTVVGSVAPVADAEAAARRFVRRHPAAAGYIGFADMHLMRLTPERAHLVAGFGRITNVPVDALLADAAAAEALSDIDADACAHMDEDHADALALIAAAWGGRDAQSGSGWRAVGIDPRGIDLAERDGAGVVRAEFAAPVRGAGPLRHALAALTDSARQTLGREAS